MLDVADHARDARAAADVKGDTKTALSAGQAEARVLASLTPLDTLAPDIAAEIQDASDALTILATVVRAHPEVAEAIVSVMQERNRTEWARRVLQMASTSNRELGDSANEHN